MYRALKTVCLDRPFNACFLLSITYSPKIHPIEILEFVEVRTSLIHYVKITYLKIKTKHALGIKYEVKSNSR